MAISARLLGSETKKQPYLELGEELQPLLGGLLLGLGGYFDRFMTFPTRGYSLFTDFRGFGPVFGSFWAILGPFWPEMAPKMTKKREKSQLFLLKITF